RDGGLDGVGRHVQAVEPFALGNAGDVRLVVHLEALRVEVLRGVVGDGVVILPLFPASAPPVAGRVVVGTGARGLYDGIESELLELGQVEGVGAVVRAGVVVGGLEAVGEVRPVDERHAV